MRMMMMAMMVDRKKERKKENRKGTKESFLSKNSFWVFFVKIRGIGVYLKRQEAGGFKSYTFFFIYIFQSSKKRGERKFLSDG